MKQWINEHKVVNKQHDQLSMNFLSTNPKKNFKILVTSAFFWGLLIAFLVWLSWYENDYSITKTIGDFGYNNRILYLISDYFVGDGYLSLTTILVPVSIIIFEQLLIYFKNIGVKNKTFTWIWNNRKTIDHLPLIGWSAIMALLIWNNMLLFSQDSGFGYWVNSKTLVGSTENQLFAIIMFVVNNLIAWSIGLYFIHSLSNRPDFTTQHYPKKILYFLVIAAVLYLQLIILKTGTGRPLFHNMIWKNLLDDLKVNDPTAWETYMQQDTFKYGWIVGEALPGYINDGYQNLPGNWEWWKSFGLGWFPNQSNPITEGLYYEDALAAFPSGHMQTTFLWLIAIVVLTTQFKNTSKSRIIKYSLIGAGIGYNFLMFFALGFTYGHWMSDMIFTLAMLPLWHLFAVMVSNYFLKTFQKTDRYFKIKINANLN